jgi:hypothetical protein
MSRTFSSPLRRAALLAGCVAVLSAMRCEDPLSPRDVAGDYLLRTIDGQSLPAVIATEPEERIVISVRIGLRNDGTGEVAHVEKIDGLTYSSVVPISYELEGARGFVAEIHCPIAGPCTVPSHMEGTFRGGRLELSRYWTVDHEWLFERIFVTDVDG